MDPEDKDYVCSLDEKTLEKAKRELFEDPQQRLGAVQTLRAWIRAQPHLTCRVDTDYLLQVLRTAKFAQLRAREIIETTQTMRVKCPEYMVNIDTHEPGLLCFIEKGQIVPLPKPDKEGRMIMLLRIGLSDPKDPLMSVANELRASLAVQELVKEKNEKQIVHGVELVFDMTGVTMAHMMLRSGDVGKNTSKIYQECSTGRVKAFHFYNPGSILDFFMSIFKTLMKKKYQERMQIHETMESLYKRFPMELWPEEYLPDDYNGPSVGSIKSISDDLKKRLTEPAFRARLLDYTSDKYKIDLSKKDNSTPQESFRKLNVD